MTVQLMEGFDHYSSPSFLPAKSWSETITLNNQPSGGTGPTTAMTTGRIGAQCYAITVGKKGAAGSNGNVVTTKVLPASYTQFVVGFAFKFTQTPSSEITFFTIYASGSAIVQINFTTGNHFRILNGSGTTIATGTFTYTNNSWVYLEMKVVVNGASGSVATQVNGGADIATTTGNFGSTGADKIGLTPSATTSGSSPYVAQTDTLYYDDIYFLDTSASPNNNFLGDVAVETVYPSAAGAHTDWTPDSGSNYARVNEHTSGTYPDDDTSYVSTQTVNNRDSYTMSDLVLLTGSVFCAQTFIYPRKDAAGTKQVAAVVRPASTDRDGATVTLGTSYLYYTELRETNPDTSAAWTATEINATEVGIKLVT